MFLFFFVLIFFFFFFVCLFFFLLLFFFFFFFCLIFQCVSRPKDGSETKQNETKYWLKDERTQPKHAVNFFAFVNI